MFSGIVEAKVPLLQWAVENPSDLGYSQVVRIVLEKPSEFSDLNIGDSIAVNGVCLTLEKQTEKTMQFALGPETLRITGWSESALRRQSLNLERSLRFGDRVHGHLVAGHVDAMGTITVRQVLAAESIQLDIEIPTDMAPLVWRKGSITVNGVSLTVNEVNDLGLVSVCLIPETLKRTNLADVQVGDLVSLEADTMARVLNRQLELNDHKGANP